MYNEEFLFRSCLCVLYASCNFTDISSFKLGNFLLLFCWKKCVSFIYSYYPWIWSFHSVLVSWMFYVWIFFFFFGWSTQFFKELNFSLFYVLWSVVEAYLRDFFCSTSLAFFFFFLPILFQLRFSLVIISIKFYFHILNFYQYFNCVFTFYFKSFIYTILVVFECIHDYYFKVLVLCCE